MAQLHHKRSREINAANPSRRCYFAGNPLGRWCQCQVTIGELSWRPARLYSHRSGPGARQFHRPISAVSDGTRNALTTVASTSTPAAMPIPSSLMKMICDVANAPIAT
jgi:hypothetical protein